VSRYLLAIVLSAGFLEAGQAARPQTRAEISEYRWTSSLQDVLDFFGQLQKQGCPLSMEFIGSSDGGQRIPMVIC